MMKVVLYNSRTVEEARELCLSNTSNKFIDGPTEQGNYYDSGYCLKDRSTGYLPDQIPYTSGLFDNEVNDMDECYTRYPNGNWCGLCLCKPHIMPCEHIDLEDIPLNETDRSSFSQRKIDSGEESDGYSYTGPTKESLCRLRYSEYCDWMDNKCYQKKGGEIDRLYPGGGCIYHSGGISEAIIDNIGSFSCTDWGALTSAITSKLKQV